MHTDLRVALHPEGVDRNGFKEPTVPEMLVALHPEGVDRNKIKGRDNRKTERSPSTRRAWIEIITTSRTP